MFFENILDMKINKSTIQGDFRILFYAGDLDLICPAIHVAKAVAIIADENDLKVIVLLKKAT